MARPKIDHDARREERLNLRLTRSERLTIEANAAFLGVAPAEYARRRVLDRRLPTNKADQKATALQSMALVRIGNNLNQLTRHANAGKGLLESEILVTLARVNAELDRLYDPAPGRERDLVQGSGPLLPA